MKVLFFIAASLILLSCKKIKETNNPDRVNATISVDGNNHLLGNSSTTSDVGRFTLPIFGNEYISILGWTSTKRRLTITLPPTMQQGTFDLKASGPYSSSYDDLNAQISYHSIDGSGTITIESFTGSYIKGTFQFSCYSNTSQEAKITNGSFEGDL